MKKRIRCLGAALLAGMLMLSGCGEEKETDAGAADPKVLLNDMMKADPTLPEMIVTDSNDEQAEEYFSLLSDMDYGRIDSYAYAYAKEGTAEEIAVIGLKDKGDAAMLMSSLKEHIGKREETFRVYEPEQVKLTEKAVVTRNGAYVTMIICKKCGLVQDVFKQEQ